ncbi:hypothetical protein PilKf_00489 [Pillotina sp. SPG140]|jgi:hypothetical protein
MAEPAKQDTKAPQFLDVTVKDNNGHIWSNISAVPKTFSTGSIGYYASSKVVNPESGERYQVSLMFTLVGSKPTAL